MKVENLYEVIGEVDENYIIEARQINKGVKYTWAKGIAVAACLGIIIAMANFLGAITYAKSCLQSYGLYVGASQIEMGEMIPKEFDIESFKTMPNVHVTQGSDEKDNDMFVLCENAEELQEYSGIELPLNEEIVFEDISLQVSGKYCNGHLSMGVADGNGTCVATMNGQFILVGNEEAEPLGYGYTQGKIKSIYKCDNGTEAYILKNKKSKDKQIVIFTADGIQYRLVVENTMEGTSFAKKVVDLMCN